MGDQDETPQGHPAWQELLEGIPQEFHAGLTAKLSENDKRVQDMVQGVHSQYAPYKEYADANIPPEIIKQSLYLANQLQSDPEAFVQRAIENFRLEGYTKAEAEEAVSDMGEWDGDDISKHPMVVEMQKQLEQINSTVQQQQQESQAQKEQREFDEYISGLQEQHKDKGGFDTLYVASLMANDVSADDAINQYYQMIDNAVASKLGTQQGTPPAQTVPVVMGGSGNAGSGSAAAPVSMGGLSNGQTQDLVTEMLEKMRNTNQ